jgi:hypothetical protein
VIKAYGDAPREMELSAEHVSMLRCVAEDVLSSVTSCPPEVAARFAPLLGALRAALAPREAVARASTVAELNARPLRWQPPVLTSAPWGVSPSPPSSRTESPVQIAAVADPCAGTPAAAPRVPLGRNTFGGARALW